MYRVLVHPEIMEGRPYVNGDQTGNTIMISVMVSLIVSFCVHIGLSRWLPELGQIDTSVVVDSHTRQARSRPAPGAARSTRVPSAPALAGVAPTPSPPTLPDWVGKPIDAVRFEAQALGLELNERRFHSPNDPAETVFKQIPSGGSPHQRGAKVELHVAITAVEVPNFRGKHLKHIRTRLEKLGLVVGEVETREHAEWSSGRVLDQDPAAKAFAAKGSAIDFVIVAPD